jgi:hypothetical protein
LKISSFKFGIIFFICCFGLGVTLISAAAQESSESVVGLPAHELGDMSLGMDLGPLIPLFFQDFSWNTYDSTLSLGGVASLQWNTYLSSFFRAGVEIGGSFNLSPQQRTLLLMPILLKITYVYNISRFEFPVFLGAGINVVRYRDWSQVDFMLKMGLGGYWRYDANWAFGLQAAWWWDFQPVTRFQDPEQARMAHYLEISPALLYSF